ncbi:MAG: ParA family protein [Proteobacteria bacterium]|nr:ParA family protein [Pseudomonadota bacterium]
MQVIAVSNRKGGTGKTTVCVNLASELAARGSRVLVIDLDSQGHCAVGLSIEDCGSTPSVHQVLDCSGSLHDAIQPTKLANLWLAAADPRFAHGRLSTDEQALRRAIASAALADRFDFILIDTPPSLDSLLINGLTAADRLLIPFVPHPLSFQGVRQLAKLLFSVISRNNATLKILGFLPVMAAEHVRQHRAMSAQVAREFGAARMLPPIRMDIRVAEAFGAGIPIRLYAPSSRGNEDFRALGEEVLRRMV